MSPYSLTAALSVWSRDIGSSVLYNREPNSSWRIVGIKIAILHVTNSISDESRKTHNYNPYDVSYVL